MDAPDITLDEYIQRLQELREQHGGDLRVYRWTPMTGRRAAPEPKLAYTRRYEAKRGTENPAPQFYNEHDSPTQRGDACIRL